MVKGFLRNLIGRVMKRQFLPILLAGLTLGMFLTVRCERVDAGRSLHRTSSVKLNMTDGTEPTLSSMKYTGPFNIEKTLSIKARAFKDGSEKSRVARAYFFEEAD